MADRLREDLLHILQHSLGLDRHGRGDAYRNNFVTGPDGDDYAPCRELVALGLMREHPPRDWLGGLSVFVVTEAGREAVTKQSTPAPEITRAQKLYRAYLRSDSGLSFGEWIAREGGTDA